MDDVEKFNKASSHLLNIEIKLNQIAAEVNSVEKDIAALNALEITLEDNLRTMKSTEAIAIASEYKKAKEDLEKCKRRKTTLKEDCEYFKLVLKHAEELHEKAKKLYEDAFRTLNEETNNVLEVDFGRKNGK